MENVNEKYPASAPRPTPKPFPVAGGLVLALLLMVGAWAIWGAFFRSSDRRTTLGAEALNVLLITLDTTRADHLGCYGRPISKTPNLDRMAREGTLFANCSTCSPLTLPSHSSIMTGTYPYVHGVRQNGTYRLTDGNVTLAEVLGEAGWRTGAAVASFVLNHRFGINQGFEVYRDVEAGGSVVPLAAERKGDQVCADAIEFLRSVGSSRFFLWVHFYDPHFPYVSIDQGHSPGAYEDEIAFMDAQIGRLMDEIAALVLEEETLVVVVGDHGEGLAQHSEMFHGYFLYQTTLRVPLIFRCPGSVAAGHRIDAQVRTIDIAPTILDALARPPLEHAQGVSLVPLMAGEVEHPELAAYAEATDSLTQLTLSPLRSLSVGKWKYVLAPAPELYDLRADLQESENVIARHADVADRMREELRDLIAAAPLAPG